MFVKLVDFGFEMLWISTFTFVNLGRLFTCTGFELVLISSEGEAK